MSEKNKETLDKLKDKIKSFLQAEGFDGIEVKFNPYSESNISVGYGDNTSQYPEANKDILLLSIEAKKITVR